MHPERTYRTETGVFSESELGILVWINPDFEKGKNSRLLMTMTDYSSTAPMAFPLNLLRKSPIFEKLPVSEDENLSDLILNTSSEAPAIVPLPVARRQLGWEDFFVPTKYSEPRP
jgi:hypothetical protein